MAPACPEKAAEDVWELQPRSTSACLPLDSAKRPWLGLQPRDKGQSPCTGNGLSLGIIKQTEKESKVRQQAQERNSTKHSGYVSSSGKIIQSLLENGAFQAVVLFISANYAWHIPRSLNTPQRSQSSTAINVVSHAKAKYFVSRPDIFTSNVLHAKLRSSGILPVEEAASNEDEKESEESLQLVENDARVCGCDLAQGGFFIKNGEYLCTVDYQRMYGTRCNGCGEFVEGEVVTALGKTYHPNCFACTVCKRPFPPGDRVTFNGRDCLCQMCAQPMSSSPKELSSSSNCAGCGRDIKNGQALLALDKQWHLGCFKCKACAKVLTGEYISKDGAPYCEKDYQVLFGVKCEACHQFITGKVLEITLDHCVSSVQVGGTVEHRNRIKCEVDSAGDKHYHPSCARCSRCNQMFTEGEEMYLQGSTVWHPDCKQSTKGEEKLQRSSSDFFYPKSLVLRRPRSSEPTRTSSESIYSRPGSSIPGSPGHSIYAKVDNEILDYKDLAAIPKVKAIYDIERPDLITYEPFYTSAYEERQERQSLGESPRTLSPTPSAEGYQDIRDRMIHRSTSQGSIGSPVYSRHSYTPTMSRSPQHFHRPELLSNGVQRLAHLRTSSPISTHNDSCPYSPFRHHFIPYVKDAASFYIGMPFLCSLMTPIPGGSFCSCFTFDIVWHKDYCQASALCKECFLPTSKRYFKSITGAIFVVSIWDLGSRSQNRGTGMRTIELKAGKSLNLQFIRHSLNLWSEERGWHQEPGVHIRRSHEQTRKENSAGCRYLRHDNQARFKSSKGLPAGAPQKTEGSSRKINFSLPPEPPGAVRSAAKCRRSREFQRKVADGVSFPGNRKALGFNHTTGNMAAMWRPFDVASTLQLF
ncbi:Actin-binding LIM protein 1 [Varanus komodoensis]|nr:Actin-binding LIM protein 1 [Varanus komodoensis]